MGRRVRRGARSLAMHTPANTSWRRSTKVLQLDGGGGARIARCKTMIKNKTKEEVAHESSVGIVTVRDARSLWSWRSKGGPRGVRRGIRLSSHYGRAWGR